MNNILLVNLFLVAVLVLTLVSFLNWDYRFEFAGDGGHYDCMPVYFSERMKFNATISDRYLKPKNRANCKPIKAQNVKLIGVIVIYHKIGTVLHKEFYQSICAHMGINFAYLDLVSLNQTKKDSFISWVLQQKVGCQDFHQCNDRALVQAKIDVNYQCINSGVKCDDWFDIQCFANQCAKLTKINPLLKILNPVRNPIDLVISTYLYHSGHAHEKWANELTLEKMEFNVPEKIKNMTVNEALNSQDVEIGLEISFQIISDVLKGMVLFSELEKYYSQNIKTFKFEKIVGEFHKTMPKQLEFLGIFQKGDLESDKQSVIKYGEWVMSEKHAEFLNKISHITAGQTTSKKFLRNILRKHERAPQLQQIASILGYNNNYTKI